MISCTHLFNHLPLYAYNRHDNIAFDAYHSVMAFQKKHVDTTFFLRGVVGEDSLIEVKNALVLKVNRYEKFV